jgi:glycosyltransferase involved in cell wall biosynthesis
MRTVLIHNLQYGGAYRRMSEQFRHLGLPIIEVTLEGATLLTEEAVIVPLRYWGDEAPMAARPVTRHLDLFSLLRAYRRLHATVRQLAPDVIWLNSCRFINSPPLPADLARLAVYHCDEPRRVDYEPSFQRSLRLRTRLPYWPMRQIIRHVDHRSAVTAARITTNSLYSVEQIRLAYQREALVIPCGVSSRFEPPAISAGRSHLLSVGTLIPSKGHDLVIEAAGRSGLGVPLVIVAPREDWQEEARLRRIARKSRVELAIRIGVSDEALVALYQSSLVTLYMSEAEPLGLVSLEAQACGSPVIVSDEGGLPETLVQGITGWAVPRRVEDITARLAKFKDGPRSEELGSAAVCHAARWSWALSSDRLRDVLNSVALS